MVNPDPQSLDASLRSLHDRVSAARANGARTELVFYYSGHSDGEGLLLGDGSVSYAALREALDLVPADVRVVVVDSCASGALIRTKGGVRKPAFLSDESIAVTGHAYLTSSSVDEAAQESDSIEGSFFTHYLLSGLRGAADLSEDGRVTLNEAYQFAYSETLARTERTIFGPQHAAYDIRLAGTGDLVITDLHSTAAGILIDSGVEGRVFVRDEGGNLAAELYKPADRVVQLGLDAGGYDVLLDQRGNRSEAWVELSSGETVTLSAMEFRPVTGEETVARGNETAAVREPLVLGVIPTLSLPSITNEDAVNVAVSLGVNQFADVKGLELALIGDGARDRVVGAQIASVYNTGGTVIGAQASFALNVANELDGAQVGFGLNLASDVDGAQVSMGANGARSVDGVNRTGYNHAQLWTGEAGRANVGVTWGGKRVYTLVDVGYTPATTRFQWDTFLGLGYHDSGKLIYMDIDLGAGVFWRGIPVDDGEAPTMVSRGRVLLGLAPAKRFGIFAGPTFNLAMNENDLNRLVLGPRLEGEVGPPQWPMRSWVGFSAGVRL